MIGYVIAGLLLASATAAGAGAVTHTAWLHWSGVVVAALTTLGVCVGIYRAARYA